MSQSNQQSNTKQTTFMTANQVRQSFIDFFVSKGHSHVPSSSLVPYNDPTLLFNNAGMNQFKDTFLGLETRDYVRAVSSQKCVRAGGKHNDLDNVGYTARHNTFFEMLGNFSFGDYFKESAIPFAWEFLTSSDYLGIDPDRLYVTIYETDDEAFDIWHKDIGLAPERIIRIGDKGGAFQSDNFWTMGDTGPCGPCSEIFYDHGEHVWGGLPGTAEEDGDRFIEIWNLVFMQYNRHADGTMEKLPKPSVDTGMGLGRISAIMQGVHGNYEVDVFINLMNAIAEMLNIENNDQASLKVIADHIRAVSFLIADGVLPSNEGRGYVLRRIIRRAVRHGNKLGATDSFFYKVVSALVTEMGDAYPQLKEKQAHIEEAIQAEESQFAKTLAQGLRLLSGELSNLKEGDTLSGEAAFKLYDTYGFPLDLTADITREKGINIDEDGFAEHMQAQRERARDAGKFDVDYTSIIKTDVVSEKLCYSQDSADNCNIIALYQAGKTVSTIQEGEEAILIMDKTPFYPEGGGQVGEIGTIQTASGVFTVQDTKKSGDAVIHHGVVSLGNIEIEQCAEAKVDLQYRADTSRNHAATHLLHAALHQLISKDVVQKGSLVHPEFLRFDVSLNRPITDSEVVELERIVNEQVMGNHPTIIEHMAKEDALAKGAMALFGEKYGNQVRVVTMGVTKDEDGSEKLFSVELDGGLHVKLLGEIGLFKIIAEYGVASGVRRIEAVTGMSALKYVQQGELQLQAVAGQLKVKRPKVAERVQTMADKQRELEKQLERLQQKLASSQAASLVDDVVQINNIPVLVKTVTGIDSKSIRPLMDDLKSKIQTKHGDNIVLIVGDIDGTPDGQLALACAVSKPLSKAIKAGDIIRYLATELGGKGGGKPDYAQGGATKADNFDETMSGLIKWIDQTMVK